MGRTQAHSGLVCVFEHDLERGVEPRGWGVPVLQWQDQVVADLEPGNLLIATPKLLDPNFARTVVYLCSVEESGAMGVVLNRPLQDVEVAAHLETWGRVASAPPLMFQGGPVEVSAGIGLGVEGPDGPPANFIRAGRAVGIVDLSAEPDELRPLRGLRVFLGYAGWTAGQLETEVEDDAWFVVPGTPEDVVDADPPTLWRRVLRRQSGKLAMFAHFPSHPRAN